MSLSCLKIPPWLSRFSWDKQAALHTAYKHAHGPPQVSRTHRPWTVLPAASLGLLKFLDFKIFPQYNILMHIYGIYKDGNDNPMCRTEKETQIYRTDFGTLWEKVRVGWSERIALKHVYYQVWNRSPVQVGCMRQVLGAGALGRPRGMRWGGRW